MCKQMVHFKTSIDKAFAQIENILNHLSDAEYSMPSSILLNASIGQHVRHIIELFIELNKGYECGTVNYEKRKRDYRIETEKHFAVVLLHDILNKAQKEDKPLILEACFNDNGEEKVCMNTNYYRELAYNIEHAIHHMALIRVGIHELSNIRVDENFGIAPATIKYRKACAQ